MLSRVLVPLAFLALATCAFVWSLHELAEARDVFAVLGIAVAALLLQAAHRATRLLEGP
ncbi:MAG: hypothetical protein FJ095_18715 [Deltaproteobacteria bacterium]|nr:hypothetical protein [Deltaproteobacteria bacterium]